MFRIADVFNGTEWYRGNAPEVDEVRVQIKQIDKEKFKSSYHEQFGFLKCAIDQFIEITGKRMQLSQN